MITFCAPYFRLMRLHQPTGICLLLWPAWWSIALAGASSMHQIGLMQQMVLLFLFLLGAIIMRSAGCIINDMWDRRIDAQVARTQHRPLASGELRLWQAWILLGLLLLAGLFILLSLKWYTILLGLVFLVMLAVYPLMKRWIAVPQVFLGCTMNAGALMGWSAVHGSLSLIPWLLYAAAFCWTLGYDTIYAHQDKIDDEQIGVKSAALAFGAATKKHICVYYVLMLLLLLSIGLLVQLSVLYDLALLCFFICLFYQLYRVDLDNVPQCRDSFKAHGWFGAILFIGILLGRYVS